MITKLIKAGKRSDNVNVLVGFLVVTFALLLVTSVTGMSFALGNMQGHEGLVKGEIVAVNTSRQTPTITLNKAGKLSPVNLNAELNIFLTDKTSLRMFKAEKSLKDIRVGEKCPYHITNWLVWLLQIESPSPVNWFS